VYSELLTLKHNNHTTVHVYFTAPYAAPVLSGTIGYTSCVWEIFVLTLTPDSIMLTYCNLYLCLRGDVTAHRSDISVHRWYQQWHICWFFSFIYKILNFTQLSNLSTLTVSVFAQHFKFQQKRFSKKEGLWILCARLQNCCYATGRGSRT